MCRPNAPCFDVSSIFSDGTMQDAVLPGQCYSDLCVLCSWDPLTSRIPSVFCSNFVLPGINPEFVMESKLIAQAAPPNREGKNSPTPRKGRKAALKRRGEKATPPERGSKPSSTTEHQPKEEAKQHHRAGKWISRGHRNRCEGTATPAA